MSKEFERIFPKILKKPGLFQISFEKARKSPAIKPGLFWAGLFTLANPVSGSLLAPIPDFIQIGQKTQKLEIYSVGRFWLVGLVGRKMVVGILNSFYVVFAPLLAPIQNFIQIGQKTQKL